MTPEEIYAIIKKNISSSRLALSGGALGAGVVEGLFNKYLPGGVLIINNSVLSQPAGGIVRLTGTGGCPPFSGMAVTARFSTISGGAAVQVEAVIGEGWHFPDSFAELAGTVLQSLDITGTRKLSLSSFDAPGIVKGLYFQGELIPGRIGALSQIFPGCTSIAIAGGIDMQHGIPQMALISNLNIPVSIGFLQGLSFQIGIICTPLVPESNEYKAYPHVEIQISSDIAFKSLGQERHLPIKASFYTDSPLVSFNLDLKDIMDISFEALQSLLDNAGVGSLVPSGFSIGDVVKLNDLSILVNLKEKKVAPSS